MSHFCGTAFDKDFLVAGVTNSGNAAAITATTFYTNDETTTQIVLVCCAIRIDTAGDAGTIDVDLVYNDGAAVTAENVAAAAAADALASYKQGTYIAQVASGQVLQYQTTLNGVTAGALSYSVRVGYVVLHSS